MIAELPCRVGTLPRGPASADRSVIVFAVRYGVRVDG